MRAQLAGVRAVAPVAQKSVTVIFVHGKPPTSDRSTGTDNEYFITQDWALSAGRTSSTARCGPARRSASSARRCARSCSARAEPIGQQHARQQRLLRGDRGSGAQGQSSFGTDQDDTCPDAATAFQRRIAGNTRHLAHLCLARRRRRHRQGAGRHRTAAARAAQHQPPARRTTFSVRDMTQIVADHAGTTRS